MLDDKCFNISEECAASVFRIAELVLVEDILLCLKYINKTNYACTPLIQLYNITIKYYIVVPDRVHP